MKLFGTSGIRGYTSDCGETDYITLSDEFCYTITQAFIQHLNNQGISKGFIAVGRDLRKTSEHIQTIVMQSILDQGCIPINSGIIPTPALNYYVKNSDCSGGIMITGSHIKASMNGLKFINSNEEISKDEEKQIEEAYDHVVSQQLDSNSSTKRSEKPWEHISKSPNFAETNNANQAYNEFLKKHARGYSGLKIVLDIRNSCHQKTMPFVLDDAGANVILLPQTQQGFIALDTESTEYENLELKQAIIENNADIGVTYDSDGDRPAFYDEQGNLIQSDVIAAIIADEIQAKNIATPINSSSVIDYLGKTGKNIYRSKVGSPYVIAMMKEHNCSFGFESNGGCIFADVMYTRDGGYPTILMLNLLVKKKQKLSQLIAQYPRFYIFRTKIDCPTRYNRFILDAIKRKFLSEQKQIYDLDGLKIYMDENTWVLFRPSSNAPEFRVFIESRIEEKTKGLARGAISLINELLGSAKKTL